MELKVEPREKFGKANKALRMEGFIPAELYGHGIKNVHVVVGAKEFENVLKEAGENSIVNVILNGEKRPVLIHDVQHDYLNGESIHVDLLQVRMDEKIVANIPIEFIGESPAIKEGGFLNEGLSEIEVEALPGDLPHNFTVDVSALDDFEKHIYVKDLPVPKGVRILTDLDTAIARVTQQSSKTVEEVTEVEDVSAVKVEGEEKKKVEASEKEENTKENKADSKNK